MWERLGGWGVGHSWEAPQRKMFETARWNFLPRTTLLLLLLLHCVLDNLLLLPRPPLLFGCRLGVWVDTSATSQHLFFFLTLPTSVSSSTTSASSAGSTNLTVLEMAQEAHHSTTMGQSSEISKLGSFFSRTRKSWSWSRKNCEPCPACHHISHQRRKWN